MRLTEADKMFRALACGSRTQGAGSLNSGAELFFTFGRSVANLAHSFMENFDTNYWGLMAMPLGLLLCFSPALFVWLKEERGGKSPGPGKDHK